MYKTAEEKWGQLTDKQREELTKDINFNGQKEVYVDISSHLTKEEVAMFKKEFKNLTNNNSEV